MKNKSVLVVSAFVTVFLLTIGIGVITNVIAKNNQVIAAPTVDTAVFVEREQAYQKMINEANQKIDQANQQITTLMNQTVEAPTAMPTPEYLFTENQASVLAQSIAGIAPKEIPVLVNFSGTPAYEVVYGNGKIYVDANTGKILYNGLQKQTVYITSDQALLIAKTYLGSDQVTAINFGDFSGSKVYVVSFSNGQSVYVNMTGSVVAVQMASNNSSSSSSQPSDDREDDHEVEHDD